MAFRVGVVVCMIGILMADVDISKLKSGQRARECGVCQWQDSHKFG